MDNLLAKQALPMTASVHWDPQQDSFEDRVAWYEKFLRQPMWVRMGLLSDKTAGEIMALAQHYQKSDPGSVGEIARIVRDVFIEKISANQINQRASEKLAIPEHRQAEFLERVGKIVLNVKLAGKDRVEREFEKMPIIPALKKYKQLANQEITRKLLKMEEDVLFEPTVKNWVNDYILKKGAQAHNALERSDYLFNSENAKNLSDKEREKISKLLESYDEDKELMIQKENGEAFFGVVEEEEQKEKRQLVKPAPTNKLQNVFEKRAENFRKEEQEKKVFPQKMFPPKEEVLRRDQIKKEAPLQDNPGQKDLMVKNSSLGMGEDAPTAPAEQELSQGNITIEHAQASDFEKLSREIEEKNQSAKSLDIAKNN